MVLPPLVRFFGTKKSSFRDCLSETFGDSSDILIKFIQVSKPRFGTAHAGGGPVPGIPSTRLFTLPPNL
jgi:hypothetical protein